MTTTSRIQRLGAAAILGLGAMSFSAMAQEGPTRAPATTAQNASADAPAAKGHGPVQRAADATKRTGKKAGNVVSNAGHKTANAVRNTGEKIGSKLPPAPRDNGLDAQGVPRKMQ